jgi:hypothetical protein
MMIADFGLRIAEFRSKLENGVFAQIQRERESRYQYRPRSQQLKDSTI